ncbi:MAG: phenylalanine--tRNA ligase subunit beta [Acidiferrobacterales bacterium]|nr:phenylalanine--tRNA ligase subunit beta [Acidiferrobacterales bacterium]
MIISEQWLRDWVGLDLSAQEIADCLTAAGLEVDGVEQVAAPIDNLLVGRVLEVEKHPDADRLNLTKVDIGSEQLEIVCGASNVRPELIVAVATVGAKLPNGLKIKKAKVRGVESFGMLCSAAELGLAETSDGLLELDADAEIGQRVDEYLQLDESLIDIDLTPNRGDCLSVQGIARELKVLADGDYHPLSIEDVDAEVDTQVELNLQDDVGCPRYICRVISGIDANAVTPLWMQERLRRSAVRPISPIVDITNYVMLELGQPMHAFDFNKLEKGIVVRQSKQGEKLTLLDDSQATLDADTLVIADHQGPIAIAGVMGGLDSSIDTQTTDIALESAHFTRSAIAGRARRYGLHTESSHRFERGVDPELPSVAMQRATELVQQICGGKAGPMVEKSNPEGLAAKQAVSIRFERLKSMLGMRLEKSEIADILNRVAEQVAETDDGWSVTPPSYRFDIECEADLVEEVARVKGYENIPTAMPRIAPRSVVASENQVSLRQVKQSLVARDYQEVINYSFIDKQAQTAFCEEEPICLANPLADNMSVMRTSLLPGLLKSLQFNQNRQHNRIRLFEAGATYHQHQDNADHDSPFRETQRIAGVISGPIAPLQWGADSTKSADFYDLKGDIEAVLSLTTSRKPIIFKEFQHISLHPGQVSLITRRAEMEGDNDVEIGYLGRLHPSLQRQYDSPTEVFVFELDFQAAFQASLPEYKSVSRFPSIKRDLSILVSQDITAAQINSAVEEALGEKLVKLVVFDVYCGTGVAEDEKSLSLGLSLRQRDKTMTDEQAESLIGEVLGVLDEQFGAKLRV